MQEIYINLDDSGKLTSKEQISVYGGLVFFSKHDKDKFITQYRSILKSINCKYCDEDMDHCSNQCPEIKNTNIKKSDKRRIMNYLKKYYIAALVIKNDKVYTHIKSDKAAKGRFIDYSIRRMIKGLIKQFIVNKTIDPHKPVRLIINIDQQTTKNNGYYNLEDGIIEELKYGISNYNYGMTFSPILFSDLDLTISYPDSKTSYVVQAADLLAGTIRKTAADCLSTNTDIYSTISTYAHFVIILP